MNYRYESSQSIKIIYYNIPYRCVGTIWPIVVIKDLDILKEVMVKQFEHFHDRPPLPDLLPKKSGSPRGFFNARGAYWKKIRATLSPFSSASKMKMVYEILYTLTIVQH